MGYRLQVMRYIFRFLDSTSFPLGLFSALLYFSWVLTISLKKTWDVKRQQTKDPFHLFAIVLSKLPRVVLYFTLNQGELSGLPIIRWSVCVISSKKRGTRWQYPIEPGMSAKFHSLTRVRFHGEILKGTMSREPSSQLPSIILPPISVYLDLKFCHYYYYFIPLMGHDSVLEGHQEASMPTSTSQAQV